MSAKIEELSEYKVEVSEDDVPFVQLGQHQLRLDLEALDEINAARAKEELRETPENVERGLKKLRQLIREEEFLDLPVDDDVFLCKFLRPCKFYPESTFLLMKRYYKFKLKHPKYTRDLTPNHIKHVFEAEVFYFLPTRTPSGARLLLANVGTKWNPKKVTVEDMFRTMMVSIEIAMMEPKTQVGGVHVMLNMEGLSLNHVRQFTPTLAKLIVDWVQECTPIRLKGIHVINQSFIFNMLYAFFKPFLGEKLKSRIFFHGTKRETLLEHVSKESLPLSLGGVESVVEYPGYLLSEMLDHYQTDFEVVNKHGYPWEETEKAS